MGQMDRDYFVEETLRRIGISDAKASAPVRATRHSGPIQPSPWRPVLIVAGLAVLLAVVVRGWRSGWW